jgi:hypothetical protein
MPHFSRHFVRFAGEYQGGNDHLRIASDSIGIHPDAPLGIGAAPSNEVDLRERQQGMDNN